MKYYFAAFDIFDLLVDIIKISPANFGTFFSPQKQNRVLYPNTEGRYNFQLETIMLPLKKEDNLILLI